MAAEKRIIPYADTAQTVLHDYGDQVLGELEAEEG